MCSPLVAANFFFPVGYRKPKKVGKRCNCNHYTLPFLDVGCSIVVEQSKLFGFSLVIGYFTCQQAASSVAILVFFKPSLICFAIVWFIFLQFGL